MSAWLLRHRPIGYTTSYTTSFPATENPISEGGVWVNGKTTGVKWNDIQTGSGNAYGTAINNFAVAVDDSIAVLGGLNFGPNQSVTATFWRAASYTPSSNHEVNLYLRGSITPNFIRGYEINLSIDGLYAYFVLWLGPFGLGAGGSYSVLTAITPVALANGDQLYAEIVGTVLKAKVNGSTIGTYDTASDGTKWSNGNPGLDVWAEGTAVLANAGLSDFAAVTL